MQFHDHHHMRIQWNNKPWTQQNQNIPTCNGGPTMQNTMQWAMFDRNYKVMHACSPLGSDLPWLRVLGHWQITKTRYDAFSALLFIFRCVRNHPVYSFGIGVARAAMCGDTTITSHIHPMPICLLTIVSQPNAMVISFELHICSHSTSDFCPFYARLTALMRSNHTTS